MTYSAQEIVRKVNNFVAGSPDSTNHADWYVGIATDVGQRLFGDHKVNKNEDAKWVYFEAYGEQAARNAEEELLELDYKGGPGGGDCPTYVYVYLITSYTDEG